MEKITWHTEKRKVKDLIPAGYNPRLISEKEKADLMESIKEYGEVEPLIINTDNKLIGGHQRTTIYADLGIEEIEVRVPSRTLTLDEEMRLNIRLNKNTGSWDGKKLREMNVDMLLEVGFDDAELSNFWDDIRTEDDKIDIKKEVEKAKETKIKTGELYQLGQHRLLCGDSTVAEDVTKLLGSEKVDMVYCDPPYNIGLDYNNGIGGKGKYGGSYNEDHGDSKKDIDYKSFIEKTVRHAKANISKGAHFFYWCDEKYIGLFQSIFEELGIDNKRVCMWIKNNANPTPQVAFNKVYEPCVYGTVGRPFLNPHIRNLNEVLNREVISGNQVHTEIFDMFNIWLVDRDNTRDYDHPTQKPITLHEKPLKRCTAPGGVVLDLFGGSGSTLIACQQLNRKAFLLEQDPIFCQVIINRWEKETGRQAEKVV